MRFFFFNDTATTEIYTLSLHDALPIFRERVLAAVAESPTPVRCVVVAAAPVTSIDVTAADALTELDDALLAQGVELRFAELKDPVKDKLRRFGVFDRVGETRVFPTLDWKSGV